MKRILLTLLTISFQSAFAQVGIGNTTPKAQLDISASSTTTPSNSDGLLIPRLDAFPSANPTAAQNGMLIFLTTSVGTNLPGFYYWSHPALAWVGLNASNKSWDVSGNSSAVSGTNFIGTTNAQDIDFRTNNLIKMRLTQHGQLEILNSGRSVFLGEQAGLNDDLTSNYNAFVGYQSGFSNTNGFSNAALGYQSFRNNTSGSYNSAFGPGAMQSNPIGNNNAAVGYNALFSNTAGTQNTAIGSNALYANTLAVGNTAVGAHSMESNVLGYGNTAVGGNSMLANANGFFNTAIGYTAMQSNVSGQGNTASGTSSLYTNTTGSHNTATGVSSLLDNISGSNNTATGAYALRDNTTGSSNTAIGRSVLFFNTTGSNNTSVGLNSLSANLTGNYNTTTGVATMLTNTIGNNNSAYGFSSLYFNTDGNNNTATGTAAMLNNTSGSNNTAIGNQALSTNISGSHNTAIGNQSNVSSAVLSNATAIGNLATVNASSKVRLGNTAVTVVEGQVAYFNPSDARFKNDVKTDVPGLDFILKLKPVTYHFDTKKFNDHLTQQLPDSLKNRTQDFSKSSSILHTGFLAQDIEQAAQSIGYDFDGLHVPDASNPTDNYSVAYSQFVIPMVKAIQEQQQEIDTVKKENAELKALAAKQTQMLEMLEKRLSTLEKNKP